MAFDRTMINFVNSRNCDLIINSYEHISYNYTVYVIYLYTSRKHIKINDKEKEIKRNLTNPLFDHPLLYPW